MSRRREPVIPDAILDQLLVGADAKTAFDPNGLIDQLKKALADRALKAELDHHLKGDESGNSRNGYGKKTVLTDAGALELSIPRDRQGSFDPQLIGKYQRRFPGFDEKIISMSARGMSTREIAGHLRELYAIDVSAELISTVTDAVIEEVTAWQNRPLEATYPLVFLGAIRVKIRDESLVRNKAIHVAIGVRADGLKEVLGLWIEQNEGAYPDTIVQTCIVHLLRHCMEFASWKDRKPIAAAPWGRKYEAIGKAWRRAWQEVIPFFAFLREVRRILYTTNAIEALNSKLRRAVRARGHFPNDEA